VLLPGSLRFGSTEWHECDKCASSERIVLHNYAWPLSTNHFRRSCSAAFLEIHDDNTAAIRRLSHWTFSQAVNQVSVAEMEQATGFTFKPLK
jgi:hypothetical protein